MKKVQKTSLSVILTLLLAVLLVSCGNSNEITEINSDNLKQVMTQFLPSASNAYKNIKFGGYKAKEDDKDITIYKDCRYAPVADQNFNSIEKIKQETEKYYTKNFIKSEKLYSVFSGDYPIYKDFDGTLKVNIDGGGYGGYTYTPSSAKIISSQNDTCVISVDCIDNYETSHTATLTLKKEDGAYKIDSAEYKEK